MGCITLTDASNGKIVVDASSISTVVGRNKLTVITFKPETEREPLTVLERYQIVMLAWKEAIKNGDTVWTSGDGENTEFINDRGGGAVAEDPPGEDSVSFIYEEGGVRGCEQSNPSVWDFRFQIHIFSDSPLAMLPTDGGLLVQRVRRKEDS